ncbi:iron-sulfur cluster insertion protein IscA [Rhodovastum atsumiense]|uniref:Iron-sulfur cluster assembly accessory protein n=1 Tax=Rhodovastum atsumiense TaxID=504468 RepID=A0A5M6J080_9PROT|nr:iron-sulfur cluster assembly accessory protein [Rhodovastum atsumiense]KAA5613619.1 iron-sulfur cluster assembly accessory protein [Rhodovastum atsumiense]CAH2599523.1 iron-sulfur cluster insertion protein IscA [Rhodovastum atsumiense]
MIHLTDSAVEAARTALARAGEQVQGLRIAVKTGGCAGFKYAMGLVSEAGPDDIMIEHEGVRLFVDAESSPHLDGTTIDFVDSTKGAGFTFDNPNATSRCSCSKSFC